jgi:hypothetical protein
MPRLNLQEATRNMVSSDDHGDDTFCAADHEYDDVYDDILMDEEYFRELEMEEAAWRQAEEDTLLDDIMNDYPEDLFDPWDDMDYRHEGSAA